MVQRISIFQRFPFYRFVDCHFSRQFRYNCDFSAAGNLTIRIPPRWLPQRIKTTNNDGFLWCYSCFRCKLCPFYANFKDTFCWRLRDSRGSQCGHQTKAKFRIKLALIHRMVTFSLNRCSWTRKSLEKTISGLKVSWIRLYSLYWLGPRTVESGKLLWSPWACLLMLGLLLISFEFGFSLF